jgi:glycosyltransferase involved in cell wall biosynthesis
MDPPEMAFQARIVNANHPGLADSIVILSTADWDHPFWTNKQHTAVALARKGFRILYLESMGLRKPTTGGRDLRRILHRIKTGLSGLRQVQDNIWVYSPLVVPLHDKPLIVKANTAALKQFLGYYCRKLNFVRPIAWAYNPLAVDMIDCLQPSAIVYHCVDRLASAPGLPSRAIEDSETRLLREADLVFTTSRALQDYCTGIGGEKVHYFPNVVDFDHFSKARTAGPIPDDLGAIPRPRIGFIGAVSSYKLDFDLIAQVARKHPEWQWILIGQVGEGQPQTAIDGLRLPNIHLLGPRPYELLPDYLRGIDVAILPCPMNDYTRAMFPMKFFEYLAAGRPVIATPLPALEEFADVYSVADTPQALESVIYRMLSSSPAPNNKALSLARQHTWEWRTDEMILLLRKSVMEKAQGMHAPRVNSSGCKEHTGELG